MTVHFDSLKATAELDAAPIPVQERAGSSWYRKIGKRAFDIAFVTALLPIVLPLLVVIAAVVLVTSGSPLYRQKRIGLDGREFTMLKFRTMVRNADQMLEAYLESSPEARAEWSRDQKLRNDPRVTKIGTLLRKTSLDELPQLLNVLFGDMSLIGPRPMLPEQRKLYPGTDYYSMRPGISGFWQISERNTCSFRDRAYYDDTYARSISLKTDLQVLARTIGVVVRGTGC